MATPPIQRFRTYLSMQKEGTWGTGLAATSTFQMVPVISVAPTEDFDELPTNPFVSRASRTQGYQYGFATGTMKFDTYAYPDSIGNILTAVLGKDTATTSGSTTSHAITVLNNALPPSYSFDHFTGVDGNNAARRFAGHYVSSVQLKGAGTGPMTVSVTSIGQTATTATTTSVTQTVVTPLIPWQAAVTLNSVSNKKLISYDVTIARAVETIPAMGSQQPSAGNSGALDVTGTLIWAPTDNTEYALYQSGSQAAFPLSLVWTSGTNVMTLQMTTINFKKGTVIDGGSEFQKISSPFIASDNTTDGGACKVTLVNSIANTY